MFEVYSSCFYLFIHLFVSLVKGSQNFEGSLVFCVYLRFFMSFVLNMGIFYIDIMGLRVFQSIRTLFVIT